MLTPHTDIWIVFLQPHMAGCTRFSLLILCIILEVVSISEVTSGTGTLVALRKDLMKPWYVKWAHVQKYSFLSPGLCISHITFGAFAHLHNLYNHTDWIRVVFLMLKSGGEERENTCILPVEFRFRVKGFTKDCMCNQVFIHNRSPLNDWVSQFHRLDNWVSKRLGVWPHVCPTPKPVLINTTFSCHHDPQLSLLIFVYLSLKCNLAL